MESENRQIAGPSSETKMMEINGCDLIMDGQMIDGFLATSQGIELPATTKMDAQQFAQNRCNAMLRYKEKKKTRRYLLNLFLSNFNPLMSKRVSSAYTSARTCTHRFERDT